MDEQDRIKFERYKGNLERVFSQLELKKIDRNSGEVIDLARRYFEDAIYFRKNGHVTTALISLAYCEGLLDALRLLKVIDFRWEEDS
ncbi:MAG: DUF357 domain-containing protein [Candidatus Bathyarchaeia archaeon]